MGLLSRCAPLLMALLLVAAAPALAAPTLAAPTEYDVKAAFLFNFSQFVDWPDMAFADAQSPLVIGVLGTDPFGNALDEIVRGETVKGRPLEVRRFRSVGEMDTCHILFIDRSEQRRFAEILAGLKGRSILTVGDFEDFAESGGVIRFVSAGNKIRLRINLDAARAANLTISSKLLRPATIVGPQGVAGGLLPLPPELHERSQLGHLVIEHLRAGVGILRVPVDARSAAFVRGPIHRFDQSPADASAATGGVNE